MVATQAIQNKTEPKLREAIILLKNLPKVSLNKIYAGEHFSFRKRLKDQYKLIIRSQFKGVFSKKNQYAVSYKFGFSSRPLDTSNTVFMLKMIEDIIFEDDTFKIIPTISISSFKAPEDYVEITISPIYERI